MPYFYPPARPTLTRPNGRLGGDEAGVCDMRFKSFGDAPDATMSRP